MGLEGGPDIPRDGILLGHLFESLVTLCVRVYAQVAEAEVMHFRIRGGRREVDLILKRGDDRLVALEVKLSSAHDGNIPYLSVDPIFDGLRDEPRFRRLIERLGLPH